MANSVLRKQHDPFKDFTAITSGTDLNDLTEEGLYGCTSGATASSLVNCPTTVNFAMFVMAKNSSLQSQLIVVQTQLFFRSRTSAGWQRWYSLNGTAV